MLWKKTAWQPERTHNLPLWNFLCYGIIFLYKLQQLPKMKAKKMLWNDYLNGEHCPLAKLLQRMRLRIYSWARDWCSLFQSTEETCPSHLFHISSGQHAEIWELTRYWPSDKFLFPLICAAGPTCKLKCLVPANFSEGDRPTHSSETVLSK